MRTRLTAVLIGAALILPGGVQAGDKSQSSLVNPVAVANTAAPSLAGPIGTSFTNGTSKGKTKGGSNCKTQVQLKGLSGLADSDGTPGTGDEVICIVEAAVTLGNAALGANGAILRGEVKGGKVKIKADLAAEGTGCGPTNPNVKNYDNRLTCYEPSAAYADCAGGGRIPFTSDPTQCVTVGSYPARPASNMIATEGLFFP
jgi:hypothetical protein